MALLELAVSPSELSQVRGEEYFAGSAVRLAFDDRGQADSPPPVRPGPRLTKDPTWALEALPFVERFGELGREPVGERACRRWRGVLEIVGGLPLQRPRYGLFAQLRARRVVFEVWVDEQEGTVARASWKVAGRPRARSSGWQVTELLDYGSDVPALYDLRVPVWSPSP